MSAVRLKAGREKSLLRHHPWVFSGAIAEVEEPPGQGDTVQIQNSTGEFLAWGAYSPTSQIRVRVWSWSIHDEIGVDFFHRQIAQALKTRQSLNLESQSNAFRLVHGESDGLPGLIADQYADTLIVQFLSAGAERWRDLLAGLLSELTGLRRVFERSDADVRALEGLSERTGVLLGDNPPGWIEINENGLKFLVDVHAGHKTGFYLDQRFNRRRLGELAAGREVLDCFCYTGGFTISALAGGASTVVAMDTSAEALGLARQNLDLNDLPADRVTWMQADVFQALRELRDRGRKFDLVVLDPPKFAPTVAQVRRAARGYKDVNLLAFKLLRPGGLLVTFSCSGGVDPALFQSIVAGAALDAGVDAQILERLSQASDHPVALNFPEGAYLKGLVVRIK
jgi:23S rRNA (cytosine1962-C5)-methyltransferase